MHRFPLFLASLVIALGCTSKETVKAAAPKAPAAVAKPAAPVEPVGVAAKGNDAELVALAAAALKCRQDGSDLFDFKCDAFKAFNNAQTLKDKDATLVTFWEDTDPRARFLGAIALPEGINDHPAFREDKALATRMVHALSSEANEAVAKAMARRVARINVETTGLLEPMQAIIQQRKNPYATLQLIEGLLFTNRQSRPTYDAFLALTHDPDKAFRKQAVDAFWIGGGLSNGETCKMWEEHLDDTSPDIAASAAHMLGMSDNCRPNDGVLIEKLSARFKAGTVGNESFFGSGLEALCKQDHATPAHRLDAARLAKAFTSSKDAGDFVRWSGMEAVKACDKQGGRAFLSKFTHDKNKFVAEKAKETLKER